MTDKTRQQENVTEKAQALYDEIQFGHLSYERKKYNPLLYDYLSNVKDGDQVFDIGCGSGYWLQVYVEAGVNKDQITGVDISPSNVAMVKKHGFQALWGDVLQLNMEDAVSDFTICNGVIHHTADPFRALQELVRITRPNGFIYLSVYNRWNPYYYIVHRATWPLRYLYWHWSKRVADFVYPVAKLFFQPLGLLLLGRLFDDKSGRKLFMDQVMTPRAYVFSKRKIIRYAQRCGCPVETIRYTNTFFMVTAVLRKSE